MRLKLANFIGIKHGCGKNEIEIDFTKSKNKIILLKGRNGSGKSTVLAQLQPFKESFDERKTLILEGKDGRKEIDIEYNGHKYEIVHIYAKSAQSFIKKDGVELNENGGVRTFEDICFRELCVDKTYFNIGKLGSNCRSFVDFSAQERKNYIGNFLNIEDIISAYKVANEKMKNLKKEIVSVTNDLSKFQEVEIIETEISQIQNTLEDIEGSLKVFYTKKGSLTADVQHAAESVGDTSLETLKNRIQEKEADIRDNRLIKTTLEAELSETENAETFKEELQKEIIEIQKEISVNSNEKQNKLLLISDTKNKINENEIELSSLGNPEDLKKLEDEIEELEKNISVLKEKIKNNEISQFISELLKEKHNISTDLYSFISFTDFIEKYYTDLNETSITSTSKNIQHFLENNFKESFNQSVSYSKKAILEKEKVIDDLRNLRAKEESFVNQLENLRKRPTDCKIDSCPFIKDAYNHRDCLSKIQKYDSEIEEAKKSLETLNLKASNLEVLQNLYKNFMNEYEKLNSRNNKIYNKFIEKKSLLEWMDSSLSEFQSARQIFIKQVEDARSDLNEYISLINKLATDKENKRILSDSDLSFREKLSSEIDTNKKKLELLTNEFETISENAQLLSKKLNEKQELSQKYSDYIQAVGKLASASVMLSTANSEFSKLSAVIDKKIEAERELISVETKINELQNEREEKRERESSLRTSLEQIKILKDKIENLNQKYEPVETITRALSPTSGIPLVFIKTYLEETELIANELLSIAFNDEFQIKFVTTEKEFAIQVFSKESAKPDIKMASQGEIAITTISLSLALIEQMIGEYNIICLDEIDGPLDPNNRNNFIEIINSQIEKLNIEQIFVISHNDVFDSASLDLVLFEGNGIDKNDSSYMENKNIIFEV